jgi:large subunit ribosomal protein L16
MIQGPKKLKFKKTKKGKLKEFNYKTSNNKLIFGTVGLKSINSGFVSIKQLEAARKAIVRQTKRKSKIWIKVTPTMPITSKPTGVRMGKGKGQFSHWGARIRGGTIIFEICGFNINNMILALKSGGKKLPFKTKIFN